MSPDNTELVMRNNVEIVSSRFMLMLECWFDSDSKCIVMTTLIAGHFWEYLF